MVRLRCEKCNDDAAVVSLVGYSATYLCEICETKRAHVQGNNLPSRRLANLTKADNTHGGDQLVCGTCKIAPARVFSPKNSQAYCWRCNEHEEKEGNVAPRYLVLGIQLKAVTTPESEFYCDPQLFNGSWNLESDTDSVLIESPHGLLPTVSVSSNLISNGSGELKSGDTSKSHDTNENLGGISQEIGIDSDGVDDVMPEGVVDGFPCGTIPVCELPGYKRTKRAQGISRCKKRRTTKTTDQGNPTQRRCMHCGVLKTPQWRAGPSGQKTLCNACGVKAARGAASGRGRGRGRGRRPVNPLQQSQNPTTIV